MNVRDGLKTFQEYGEKSVDGEDAERASLEDGIGSERWSGVGFDFEKTSGVWSGRMIGQCVVG